MATEVRDFGDNATLVVYTDDRQLANQISMWRELKKAIPYEQNQYSKKRVALVGLDFYLPNKKRIRRRLERNGVLSIV